MVLLQPSVGRSYRWLSVDDGRFHAERSLESFSGANSCGSWALHNLPFYPNPYIRLHEACFTSPIQNSSSLGMPEFSFN